jgi:uncharacterized protein (TIGR02231 family)
MITKTQFLKLTYNRTQPNTPHNNQTEPAHFRNYPMNNAITAITIFPDRARVTRTSRFDAQIGPQQITIANLPLALIPESVRASGKAKAKLIGVSTRLENFLDTPSEATHDLEIKIQDVTDADANLAARAVVLEKEQKALDGLATQSEMFARGLALRNRTPEEQGLILDFLTRRSQAIQTELLALSRSRREKTKEIDRLKRLLKTQQSAQPKQRYTATIELEILSDGELELELSYVVHNACWKPMYDLRLYETLLDLTYLAEVSQNTGEDWIDVQLTLSTAEPSLTLEIPELTPWYISPKTWSYPPRAAAKAAMPMPAAAPTALMQILNTDEGGARAAESPAPVDELIAVDHAVVSEAGPSLTYRLSGRADVPGNGDPRKVTVTAYQLKPSIDYVTAPKLEKVCYRRATVKNESPYSLMAGPAQLFEGDDYLGATKLEFVAPNQEFELVLGADERMRVDRELKGRDVEKAFIVGDRKRVRFSYFIEIENLRDAAQSIVVRDQMPVPRDEQIKVKLESAEPRPAEHTQLQQLEWKLNIAPGTKSTIEFDFTVEFPRTMDVVGLP